MKIIKRRIMFVNVGASNTLVVIACGMEAVFIKYLDIGGRLLDDAVSKHLKLSPADAASLRSRNGDGRSRTKRSGSRPRHYRIDQAHFGPPGT